MKDKSRDRELGMDRPITRRDFLNGVALTVGGAAALAGGFDHRAFAAVTNANPPALAGLRGHSEAAMNVMHSVRDGAFWDTAPAAAADRRDAMTSWWSAAAYRALPRRCSTASRPASRQKS